jgi:DNA repair protein RadB
VHKVLFDCGSLDTLLDGGVESSCVTLLYGEGGTGKTNLCLVLARNVALHGKKVVYLDTEGVSLDRFKQICGEDFDKVLKSVLFFEASSFDEQEKMVDKAIKLAEGNTEVGMIVVDSITMFYRLTSQKEDYSERRSLTSQSIKLLGVARKRDIPVVLTSQVYTDVKTGTYESLGGHPLQHNAKTIIRLDRVSPGRRRAIVMKHRNIAEEAFTDFKLSSSGIDCEIRK